MGVKNAQGREVWFEKIFGSYMPCHWKGWAVIFAGVTICMATMALVYDLLLLIQRPDLSFLALFPFIPAFIIMIIIAERHI